MHANQCLYRLLFLFLVFSFDVFNELIKLMFSGICGEVYCWLAVQALSNVACGGHRLFVYFNLNMIVFN